MSKINFNLQNKERKFSAITARFTLNGKRYVYPTGERVRVSMWSKKTHRIVNRAEFESTAAILNPRLDHIEEIIESVLTKLIAQNKYPDAVGMRAAINEESGKNHEENEIEAYTNKFFIDGKHKGSPVAQHYKQMLARLKAYCTETGRRASFADMDIQFMEGFVNFMGDEAHPTIKGEKRSSHNTVIKHYKKLKAVCRHALKRGYNVPTSYNLFEVSEEKTRSIYLNEKEIDTLYSLTDFSQHPHMEAVRDIFVLGCLTGQRHSDWNKLNKSHIKTKYHRNGNGYQVFEILQEKTGMRVDVPIVERVFEILEKYKGFPKVHSLQYLNRTLPKLAEFAGINEKIEIKPGKRVPKFKMCKTHSARRSFATNGYKAGVPVQTLMVLTGHTTEKSFMKYICITQEEHSQIAALHPFFTGERQLKAV